jgi:ribosomal-protein-alanine N-acetyltransferase
MKIDKMQIGDLDKIMAIENASFVIPWKKSFFEYDLRRPDGYCYVAKGNDEILGYIDAWHIADELHLANLAVIDSSRHKGIGSQLLLKIVEVARINRCAKIFLEVRLTNIIAQKFYEKFGFHKLYHRKKYYPDGEDALIYEKEL